MKKTKKRQQKKPTEKMILIGLIAVAVIAVAAVAIWKFCGDTGSKPGVGEEKTVDYSALGMTISLPEEFEETTITGIFVTYRGKDALVSVMKQSFEKMPDMAQASVEEFASGSLTNGNLSDDVKLEIQNGIPGFDFIQQNPQTGSIDHHFVKFYKSDDAFWICQFIVAQEKTEEYEPRFEKWAQTLRFD